MNFDFNFVSTGSGGSSSSATNSPSMLDNYEQRAANTFDSLMSGSIVNESTLNIDSIANEKSEDMSQAGRYLFKIINHKIRNYIGNKIVSRITRLIFFIIVRQTLNMKLEIEKNSNLMCEF